MGCDMACYIGLEELSIMSPCSPYALLVYTIIEPKPLF